MNKKIIFIFLIAIVSMLYVFADDPVIGLWKSVDEKTNTVTGVWNIYEKDGKLFGHMIMTKGHSNDKLATACTKTYKDFPKAGKVSEMPLVGTPFIYNLVKKDVGSWHKGYIIDPKDGKYYNCKIRFKKADGKKYKNDLLEMRGEIGLGIGRSQYWEKTTQEEADELIKSNVVK